MSNQPPVFDIPDSDSEPYTLYPFRYHDDPDQEGYFSLPRSHVSPPFYTPDQPPEIPDDGFYFNFTLRKTILHFPDFILGTKINELAIMGTDQVLSSLRAAVQAGACVQRGFRHGAYEAYGPLQLAIHGMYEQLGMPVASPSAMTLCEMHLGPDFNMISHEKFPGWEPRVYSITLDMSQSVDRYQEYRTVCLKTMTVLLEMLAAQDRESGMYYASYQLGVVAENLGVTQASIFPAEQSNTSATAWLFHTSSDATGNWFGISRETQPLVKVQPRQARLEWSDVPSTSHPMTPLSEPTKSTFDKRKRKREPDESPSEGQKRRTAQPVLEMRRQLPASLSPDQIFENHADKLSYHNLLRVALWYSNIDIHNRIRKHAKDPSKAGALSAVAKRIGVAIDHLAELFLIPKEALRKEFDDRRKENGINARGKPESEQCLLDQQFYRLDIEDALATVRSASRTSGLDDSSTSSAQTRDHHSPNTPRLGHSSDIHERNVDSCWPTPQGLTKTGYNEYGPMTGAFMQHPHTPYNGLSGMANGVYADQSRHTNVTYQSPAGHAKSTHTSSTGIVHDTKSNSTKLTSGSHNNPLSCGTNTGSFGISMESFSRSHPSFFHPYVGPHRWVAQPDNTGTGSDNDFHTPRSDATEDTFYEAYQYPPRPEVVESIEQHGDDLHHVGTDRELSDLLSAEIERLKESPYGV